MKGEKRTRTEEKQSKKNKGRKSGEVKNLTGM
jgi:ribosomal protein S20